jgi:ABC-2 type transport system permease protein
MNKGYLKSVLNVAKWEFSRYFKIMDLIKGALWMIGFGLIGGLFGFWIALDTSDAPDIAVAGYGVFEPGDFETNRFRFHNHSETTIDELRERLLEGEFDGVISFTSADEAELWIPSERGWVFPLNDWLNDQRRDLKLREFQIESTLLEDIEKGIQINTNYEITQERTRADYFMAGGAIFLVLMAVFLGFGCLFAGITGEKQQRITEQIISAITPGVWIDGKILGISAVGLAYVMIYGALAFAGGLVFLFYTGTSFSLMLAPVSFSLVLIFLCFVMLGILMFNSFFAAVASVIDDPNSSERGGLMFLPMLPVFFSFAVLTNPDSLPMQVMGMFPLTSFAVQPARMVMTSVPAWEIIAALVILLVTVWLLRYIAGRIFATGMLIYGKEPSFQEIMYWFRRA